MGIENVIEQKVTRSELLDILVHELTDDLSAQHKAMEETVRALNRFTWEDVCHLFTESAVGEVELHKHEYGRDDEKFLRIEAVVRVPVGSPRLGAALRKRMGELEQAEKDKSDLGDQLRKIHGERGGLRVRMLKQLLCQTEDGKKLIELMEGMKASARKQLALKPKAQP